MLIIDPIHVDQLTYDDINVYHITDNASAIISLPNSKVLQVPKSGGEFDITGCGLSPGSRLNCKLYMYDRQPNNPQLGDTCYFSVASSPILVENGVAKMNFKQNGPFIAFHLVNS